MKIWIQCLKMPNIETTIEAPITTREFATDPTTLAPSAASGPSAAAGPSVTAAPPVAAAPPAAGAAAGDEVAEAAAKKSARRRRMAKEVKEIG